jgi:hypothetical protein
MWKILPSLKAKRLGDIAKSTPQYQLIKICQPLSMRRILFFLREESKTAPKLPQKSHETPKIPKVY